MQLINVNSLSTNLWQSNWNDILEKCGVSKYYTDDWFGIFLNFDMHLCVTIDEYYDFEPLLDYIKSLGI